MRESVIRTSERLHFSKTGKIVRTCRSTWAEKERKGMNLERR